MSAGIPIVGGAGGVQRPQAAEPTQRATTKTSFAKQLDPAARDAEQPPPEVRAEVQAAMRAANRLEELGRRLHFERDEQGGPVRIEVRDLDGNVLRQVASGEVFDFAAGRRVD